MVPTCSKYVISSPNHGDPLVCPRRATTRPAMRATGMEPSRYLDDFNEKPQFFWISLDKSGMLTKEDGEKIGFRPNVDDLASDLGNCDLVFSSENEDLLNFGDVGELEAAKIIRFEAQFNGCSMVGINL